MPRTSDVSKKACLVLLLLELLRKLQPDLRPVAPESLLSLVGGKRRPSRRARVAVRTAVKELKSQGAKLTDPLDLVNASLAELPFDPLRGRRQEAPNPFIDLAAMGIILQPSSRRSPRTLAEVDRFLAKELGPVNPVPAAVPAPFTGPVPVVPGSRQDRLGELLGPLEDERVREIACGVAAPFLTRGLFSGVPIVQGGAIVGLSICGFEFAE